MSRLGALGSGKAVRCRVPGECSEPQAALRKRQMSCEIRDALLRQFDIAWALTEYHLNNLATEECLWRPGSRGLHVQRRDGAWVADWPEREGYDIGPSSIAWITWHMLFWWSSVLNHSFGSATLIREDVPWPGSAEAVKARLVELQGEWRKQLQLLDDAELRSTRRTRWPFQDKPFMDVVGWLNIELTKNAAELGYVRFLYGARG
jgi:hypothetical protein